MTRTADEPGELAEAVNHDGAVFELHPHRCPTCEHGRARYLGLRGGTSHRYGLGFESPIYRCSTCGLIYPNPLPLPRDPNELYGDVDKYFAGHPPAEKQAIARGHVEEALRRLDPDAPRRMLDVGSGRGEVLAAAKEAGIEAIGLELSDAFARESTERLGVEVRVETVEELCAEEPPGSFGIVILNAVLEHVSDPDSMIRAVATLLAEGGVVRVDLPREPNMVSLTATAFARLRRPRINFYLAPTWEPYHLHGFSPKSLAALLRKHGLEIDQLQVRSMAHIAAGETLTDRLRSMGGSALLAIGNRIGMSANMDGWASRPSRGRRSEAG